jgi:RimJ/RimL family protein N-acetyltransferase
MPHYKKLVGEKCYLSPCQPEDASSWAEWFNDVEVTLPLGDEAYVPAGLERMQEDLAEAVRQREHVFSIVDLETERLIGRGLLFGLDLVNRSAMLGIVIGEKACWGRGYGQDATRLLLDYAFNLLNLNSVMLGAFAFNERALAAYRRVGFKEIGRRREARIIAGQKHDVVLMDILASEFGGSQIARLMDPSRPPRADRSTPG